MSATVVADVFSGVPNPKWTIEGALASEATEMLRRLPRIGRLSSVPRPPDLGYRGLVVHFLDVVERDTSLRVFGGYVIGSQDAWADKGRALEAWLLQTGIKKSNATV